MDINYELYKVFYYVAKSLSFSGASEQLFISQSAVSQAVKSLEKKMQCLLFVRNTKQVKLTQEGAILFRHIEQAFNFIKAGERTLEDVHSLRQGEVRIGASDTICKHYLLPFFKTFINLYPNIKIQVTNRTSPQCIDLLKKGMVDLIIINIPEKPDKFLKIRKVKDIQDVFIAGENYRKLANIKISLKDLAAYPVLMLEKNTVTREFIERFLKDKKVLITPEIELGSLDLLVELARIGLGISFVTRDFIQEDLAKGEVFEINLNEKIPPRSLGIATGHNVPIPVAAEKFSQLLEENIKT